MGEWKHKLRGVNPETKTGICAHCGPVKLRWRAHRNQWSCLRAENAYRRATNRRKRAMGIPRPKTPPPYHQYRKDHCERCGFVAADKCQLDVHHLNGDHSDNRPENLLTLCANCHRLEHFSNGRYVRAAEPAGA